MNDLSKKKCVPCEGGVTSLTESETDQLLKKVKNWEVIDNHHLKKSFNFIDFKSALSFVNKVGELSENENHHPNISLSWGEVIITLWTHTINGLHENDFILASKIDELP